LLGFYCAWERSQASVSGSAVGEVGGNVKQAVIGLRVDLDRVVLARGVGYVNPSVIVLGRIRE
jgi:hypothetical protein